jgi:hypothetical protein
LKIRAWDGIDISPMPAASWPNACATVCSLPESEPLWKAGRGFVVRDLSWTVEKLRVIPPFEFENWAVIALGGIPNKVQVGDMGVDGRLFFSTFASLIWGFQHRRRNFVARPKS